MCNILQSFCAALHQELTEYYRLMAVLEAQLQQEQDLGIVCDLGGLTLRRLLIWTSDPLVRLKALAALTDVCKGRYFHFSIDVSPFWNV
jgi:gamma-tubulin complex component 3